MLHMFAVGFKCFSGVFASECFKNKLGVAHGMPVRSSRRHERRLGQRGPTADAVPRELNALGKSAVKLSILFLHI
jgi:hypothetical protein